jgi:ATP-dependent RNA helicase DOB1
MYEEIKNLPSNNLTQLLERREKERLKRCESLKNVFSPYLKKGRVVDIILPRAGASVTLRNCIVENVYEDKIGVYVLTSKDIRKIEVDLNLIEEVYQMRAKLNFKVFIKEFEKVQDKDAENGMMNEILKIEKEIAKEAGDGNVDLSICFLCKKPFVFCLSDCSKDLIVGEVISADFDVEALVKKHFTIGSTAEPSPQARDALEYIRNENLKMSYTKKFEEMTKLLDVYHMDECKKMIKVLKSLEYCDETTVLVKGKLACEISSGDELVLTEMIFNGDFTKLAINEFVPLLSCLVFEEWNDEEHVLSEENKKLYGLIEHSVQNVCKALKDHGLPISPKKYLRKFSYELMDVVKMWVDGKTFIQICENTEVFEGSIIRTFKRLEELLKQLSNAARIIGNVELENMFTDGILSIKRDIVFANSLYI